MKGDILYWSLTRALDAFVWGGELMNPESLPDDTPVVFVANHAGALGPIAIVSSLPVRIHPWVIGDMMDPIKAAEYLRVDFVEPQLHFPRGFSHLLAKLISKVSVRLLSSIGSIPVWSGDEIQETFRLSLECLETGKNLLIFPEDPSQPMNAAYGMRPFKKGFARLGEGYFKRTGKILRFYPLAVHLDSSRVKVGKPISFNPFNDPVRERIRIKNVLESSIHELYLTITYESYAGIPLPH